MKLYVMRHGPAEDVAASGRDFDRVLTTSGRARVKQVADELLRRDEAVKAIYSSPLARALQTAELVALAHKPANAISIRTEIAPTGDMAGLVKELLLSGEKRVMLVGHEPDVSSLVDTLLPGGFSSPFDKAMVVGLRITADNPAEMRFVLEPKGLTWRS